MSSTLSAKAYLHHKGLFYHLCLPKLLLTNHIVIGEKIKSLEQVSLRHLSEFSVLLENVSVSRNVRLQSLFNSEIQKGLFYYSSCHPNGPLDKKVLKHSAGWTVSEYLFAFYHFHIDEPTISGWYSMVKMSWGILLPILSEVKSVEGKHQLQASLQDCNCNFCSF